MLDLRPISPRAYTALIGSTALLMTLGAGSIAADIVIDEFSHVDIFENPWPYVQSGPGGGPHVFETVEDGVIQGDSGRIRETDIHLLGFGSPDDHAELGVETMSGTFDHTATAGVSNILQFSYSFFIENDLNVDLSETIGFRIDLADLQPDAGGYLQMSARIADSSGVISESGLVFEAEPGPHSVLLPFADFDAAGVVNLADIGAIEISLYATPGTDFSIERLVAAHPIPGDANADLAVDIQDFLAVLAAWGRCPGCGEDFDNDGMVGITDLLIVLTNWGL